MAAPRHEAHDLVALIGASTGPVTLAWSMQDVILYALGVGAGLETGGDLHWTTETNAAAPLQVLPSFLTALPIGRLPPALAHIPAARMLHGQQSLDVCAPIPTETVARMETRLTDVVDLGVHAGLVLDTDISVAGRDLARMRMMIILREAGGFAPDTRPPRERALTVRPDAVDSLTPLAGLPLLYRLSGDRHPLHSDPVFARALGFDGPILHGMCTYGMACRLIAARYAGGDARRITHLAAGFRAPAYPGTLLTLATWRAGAEIRFTLTNTAGGAVLDAGRARLAPP